MSLMTPWNEWEDYQSGLYLKRLWKQNVASSARLLASPDEFWECGLEMIREWPKAAEQNLARHDSGHQPWIGQATCCYVHGATDAETREAWGKLTNDQQDAANKVADAVKEAYLYGRNRGQTLFDL